MDSCDNPIVSIIAIMLAMPIVIVLWAWLMAAVYMGLRDWKLDRIRKAKKSAEAAL